MSGACTAFASSLVASLAQIRCARQQDLDRVQARRKLLLVLDLDHTLLNSCRDSDLEPEHRDALHAQLEAQQDAVRSCTCSAYSLVLVQAWPD